MTIVFTQSKTPSIISLSVACKAIHNDTIFWEVERKPVLDMIREIRPTIIFCEPSNYTDEFVYAINKYSINSVCVGNSTQSSILQEYKPLTCITTLLNDDLRKYLLPHQIELKPAANITSIYNGNYNKNYDTDILYYANTNNNYDNVIIERLLDTDYKFKIVGVKIPFINYVGLTGKELPNIIKSTKIGLDFNLMSLYDFAANGVLAISNVVNDIFPHSEYRDELMNLINYYLDNKSAAERKEKIIAARTRVLQNDTYLHRLNDIFTRLNMKKFSNLCVEYLGKL